MNIIDHGHDDPLTFERDPRLAAQIRNNLPGRAQACHVRASRFAAVLDQEAKFLADTSGKVEPPERPELIAALRFAAEQLRDAA